MELRCGLCKKIIPVGGMYLDSVSFTFEGEYVGDSAVCIICAARENKRQNGELLGVKNITDLQIDEDDLMEYSMVN